MNIKSQQLEILFSLLKLHEGGTSFYNQDEILDSEKHFDILHNLIFLYEKNEFLFDIEKNKNYPRSYLKCFNNDRSELTHSSLIASLLDSDRFGGYAIALFKSIFSFHKKYMPNISSNYLKTYRELKISSFGKVKNSNKLIDIFSASNGFCLIIENKVDTTEHGGQTIDYFNAVSNKFVEDNICAILLAPRIQTAECSKYFSMTYYDLYSLLTSIPIEMAPERSRPLIESYIGDIFHIFIQKEYNYRLQLRKFWEIA